MNLYVWICLSLFSLLCSFVFFFQRDGDMRKESRTSVNKQQNCKPWLTHATCVFSLSSSLLSLFLCLLCFVPLYPCDVVCCCGVVWGETNFGQNQVWPSLVTMFGQIKFGQDQVWPNKFGQKQVWPNVAKTFLEGHNVSHQKNVEFWGQIGEKSQTWKMNKEEKLVCRRGKTQKRKVRTKKESKHKKKENSGKNQEKHQFTTHRRKQKKTKKEGTLVCRKKKTTPPAEHKQYSPCLWEGVAGRRPATPSHRHGLCPPFGFQPAFHPNIASRRLAMFGWKAGWKSKGGGLGFRV